MGYTLSERFAARVTPQGDCRVAPESMTVDGRARAGTSVAWFLMTGSWAYPAGVECSHGTARCVNPHHLEYPDYLADREMDALKARLRKRHPGPAGQRIEVEGQMLTLRQVAQKIGVSYETVRRRVAEARSPQDILAGRHAGARKEYTRKA